MKGWVKVLLWSGIITREAREWYHNSDKTLTNKPEWLEIWGYLQTRSGEFLEMKTVYFSYYTFALSECCGVPIICIEHIMNQWKHEANTPKQHTDVTKSRLITRVLPHHIIDWVGVADFFLPSPHLRQSTIQSIFACYLRLKLLYIFVSLNQMSV